MSGLSFAIRQARVADAPVLAAAARAIAATPGTLASRPHELRDEDFAARIAELAVADNGRWLVAETDAGPIGHAIFDPLRLAATRHVVHLTLAVHPGWQRQGVGAALLAELLAWARAAPAVEKAEIHVRTGNTPAQALYHKLGFVEEGRLRRRIKVAPGQYLDDVLLGLWLK